MILRFTKYFLKNWEILVDFFQNKTFTTFEHREREREKNVLEPTVIAGLHQN